MVWLWNQQAALVSDSRVRLWGWSSTLTRDESWWKCDFKNTGLYEYTFTNIRFKQYVLLTLIRLPYISYWHLLETCCTVSLPIGWYQESPKLCCGTTVITIILYLPSLHLKEESLPQSVCCYRIFWIHIRKCLILWIRIKWNEAKRGGAEHPKQPYETVRASPVLQASTPRPSKTGRQATSCSGRVLAETQVFWLQVLKSSD